MITLSSKTILIRRIAAIALLLCLCLPLYECGGKKRSESTSPPDTAAVTAQSATQKTKGHSDAKYIWTDFDITTLNSWLRLFVFVWPPLILTIYAKVRGKKFKVVAFIIEPILIAYFGYGLVMMLFFLANPLIGGYIAMAAYLCLAITWITDLILNIRSRTKRWT